MNNNDYKYPYFTGSFVALLVAIFLFGLIYMLFHNSHQGDVENTNRTKARYEMCATIPDASARTLCSLDIKTGY
jgi:hypothetical protein